MKNILILFLFYVCSAPLAAQCIVLDTCPATVQVCDFTTNNADFWNETYWFDQANSRQDLADAPVTASITVRDTCPGATASIRYLLFLDLDKNGSWETVIKSWEPPAPGTVNFNNWNEPNFDGGEVRLFDERPVVAGDKYQFAIKTILIGDAIKATLSWNTPNQPNTYINTELPYATHKIKWLVEDNLGDSSTCEYSMVIKDCQKPTVVCLNGLAVNIMPTEQVDMWAADFLQYTEDNTSPGNIIQIGIRKSGSGIGFPTQPDGSPNPSLTFQCSEIGTQGVELWARDAAGNADYCETYVIVQDNANNCGGAGGNPNAPKLVCTNGLVANIDPSNQAELFAADFLQYAEDDLTPVNLLEFSIRECSFGPNEFPTDVNGDPVQSIKFSCTSLGTNCVQLWARDTDGNVDFCETYVIPQDNAGHCGFGGGPTGTPSLVCLNGLSVNLLPTGNIDLHYQDFLQYAQDDITPANLLEFSLRKCGAGAGFPLDGNGDPINQIIFDCSELGTQCVEVWARDQDGNADYVETYVVIQDNANSCAPFSAEITTCITNHCNASPVHGAWLTANQSFIGAIGPLDPTGCALFPTTSIAVGSVNIKPRNSLFPLNGVTVFDLIRIKRFILGLDTDLSPYEMIAADANLSQTITGFDLIELRKLILGTTDHLPNFNSWRFVDASFVFPNPLNPFQTVFPEFVNILNAAANTSFQIGFKAIKIGDLDCDAWPGLQAPVKDRDLPSKSLTLPEATLLAGETSEITLQMSEPGDWAGLQMGLQYDPAQVEILEVFTGDLPGLDGDAFYLPGPGKLNFVWADEQARHMNSGQTLLTIRIRARTSLKVREVFSTAKDFENLGSLGFEPQTLTLDYRTNDIPVSLEETTILIPQPNPTLAGATIPVRLAQSERVRVEVLDLSGKILWSNELESSAGSHLLEIKPESMPQAGVYIWRVKAGARTASGKLIKI
jgi:hypothetical protein